MTKDILKFSISKKDMQFPLDEIINEKDRLARAWVSVEVKDKDGDLITISDMRKTMNTWMKRGAPISDSHSNRVIGKGLNWTEKIHPETGKPGIEIDYQIFDDYTIDEQVWEEIKSGERAGLSFGGRATEESKLVKVDGEGDDGGLARKLAGIEGYEISSVTDPANQHALNTKVNFLAKSAKGETMNKNEIKIEIINELLKSLDIKKQDGGHLHSSEDPTGKHLHGDKNESEDLKTKECKDKYEEDNQEGSKVKKQDDIEGKKPDEGEDTKKEEGSKEEDRVAILEEKLDKIQKMISKIAKADDSEEEEDTKKAEDSEDKKDDKDVDKEGTGEKVVTEAPAAGETNETATEEGDKITITEKSLKKMMAEELTKAMKGIQKVSTPRPATQDIKKSESVEKPKEMAMEFLKKAKEGTISASDMTRAIKKQAMAHKEAKGEQLKKIIAQEDE